MAYQRSTCSEQRQNNNSLGGSSSTPNARNAPEGELEILSDMRWIKYLDPQGQLIIQDADGCGFSRGPSARIAAPTPTGGYWVKSPVDDDFTKIEGMILESGASEVRVQMSPVFGEATSRFNNDPQISRFVEYASGRPPTREGPGSRLAVFDKRYKSRQTSKIARIEPA
ncbi:hypothetical protein FALBO_10674 [Fusarium albosuccineum]|uniref:Uncharacterized protein n=1 Tax=Fusarium albosuccineum TaxID=1237068 RepID=A0A8H4L585_9HYPO|nr:hypothetical protein FALBO_10674 [Fusarium albosuccineum]